MSAEAPCEYTVRATGAPCGRESVRFHRSRSSKMLFPRCAGHQLPKKALRRLTEVSREEYLVLEVMSA